MKAFITTNGEKWFPVISDENVTPVTASPVIFLRHPGFLWLGINGELTDTLSFELAAVDQSGFTYQWYKRDPVTLLSTVIEDATSDTLFISDSDRASYGITEAGKVYQFYCVVVNGSQYGISGTGYVVYGPGARLLRPNGLKSYQTILGFGKTAAQTLHQATRLSPVARTNQPLFSCPPQDIVEPQ